MKLSLHTDYGLRVLMALAAMPERRVTIEDLATRHRVSRNHLMKVVLSLVNLGLVKSTRGRNGGLALARAPDDIRIGAVVRALETDLAVVACLGDDGASCIFTGACRLTRALSRAVDAFIAELDRLTLADVAARRDPLRERLGVA